MNRSLLLVICDFLLLSLLGFVRLDIAPITSQRSQSEPQYATQPLADARDDLIAMLEISLEQARDKQAVVEGELSEKNLQWLNTEKNLKENLTKKESYLKQLEDKDKKSKQQQIILENEVEAIAQKLLATEDKMDLQKKDLDQKKRLLEANKKALENKLAVNENALQQNERKRAKLQDQLIASDYRSQIQAAKIQNMKEILDANKDKLQILEAALAKSNAEKKALIDQKIQAESRLQDSQTKQVTLMATLETERAIRNELSNQTNRLVAGFQNLTESSEKVVEAVTERTEEVVRKIDSTLTLSPNEVFEFFQKNLVTVIFESQELGPLSIGYLDRQYISQSPVIIVKGSYFALLHKSNSPFGNASDALSVRAKILCGDDAIDASELFSDVQDSSLLWVQLPTEWFLKQNKIPVEQTKRPFAFQKAILINPKNLQYGSLDFRIDSERFSPFIKTDNRLSTRLFGDFRARAGDYLFTQNGKLLGIQTTSENALWIQEPELIAMPLN